MIEEHPGMLYNRKCTDPVEQITQNKLLDLTEFFFIHLKKLIILQNVERQVKFLKIVKII